MSSPVLGSAVASPSPSIGSEPIAEYAFDFDDEHYVALKSRSKSVAQRRRERATLALWAIVLGLYLTHSIVQRNWIPAIGVAAVLILGVALGWFVRFFGRNQFRLSSSYGGVVRLRVGPSGIEAVGRAVASTYDWSAFSKAIVVEDGVVLVMADGYAMWIPDAARSAGSREAVLDVVTRQVRAVERR